MADVVKPWWRQWAGLPSPRVRLWALVTLSIVALVFTVLQAILKNWLGFGIAAYFTALGAMLVVQRVRRTGRDEQ